MTLRHGVNDLREWGISNRVSSFRVEGGEWRVCTGVGFSGYCENIRGVVRDLNGTPLQDSISSLRPVRRGGQGGGPGGSWQDTAIAVYALPGFRGRSWVFSDDVRDLSRVGLNDQISSVRVFGGRWQICEQRDFRMCRDVMRDIPDLRAFGMDNRITSIREGGGWGWGRGEGGRGVGMGQGGYGQGGVVGQGTGAGQGGYGQGTRAGQGGYGQGTRAGQGGYGQGTGAGQGGVGRSGMQGLSATLFEGSGFSGRAFEVSGEIRNLQEFGFNDMASSIRVTGGRWQVCEHENFGGRCQVIDGSVNRLDQSLDKRISSIRPY